MITAVATLILIEEGKLRLEEPVDRLLPEPSHFAIASPSALGHRMMGFGPAMPPFQ
jgi:CubicO group peptidase (beta-lactamase class C family)